MDFSPLSLMIGMALGGGLGALLVYVRLMKREVELTRLKTEVEERLVHTFKSLSSDALAQNNASFLQLAKGQLERLQEGATHELDKRRQAIDALLTPVRTTFEKFEGKLSELERTRAEQSASLKAQISSLASLQQELAQETTKLSTALKATAIRGRWGEIQLRRVVELAGMVDHCDFYEQQTATSEEGRLRPDLLIRLPAGRNVVVDAKAPLDAYLEASEAKTEESRRFLLQKHAQQIRNHVKALASRGYTEHFKPSPEFVVLFLPGEAFYSAALASDPTLIELGAEKGVILATPTTLIALLRAVFYGWRQENLSANAEKVSALGRELYKRLQLMSGHFGRVGKSLEASVKAYNEALGSLERRVLVTARQFETLEGIETDALEPPPPIELSVRP
ncbi:MAG: DNA recombination protein RmuC [Parachlamydiales bacterium]